MALLVEVTFLELVRLKFVRKHPSMVIKICIQIVWMRDVLEFPKQQLLLRIAHNIAQRLIDLQPPPIGCDKRHADGGIFESAGKTGLACAQLLHGLLALDGLSHL